MSDADKGREVGQPGFVLHSYPFRETSLVVEAFSRDFGRVALVAKGARRPKSTLRGQITQFQPLLLSWLGKSELRTLTGVEWQGGLPLLKGQALICGFYLNELLLKLLARDDSHERLFHHYESALRALADGESPPAILRRFEKELLKELGYGLVLDRDVEAATPIIPEERYSYILEKGPVLRWEGDNPPDSVEVFGQTLIDLAQDRYESPVTLQQSRNLMRFLLSHYLGDQTLHTRQLLMDLQQL